MFGENLVEEEIDIVIELVNLDLEWSELTISLQDFAKTFTRPQPILICEGKYNEWGANTEEDPDLYPLLFALYKRYKFRIEAQCMDFTPEGKIPVGPRFEIGDDFDGWFEIVSEDGSPMFQIESVSDLAKHPEKPFVVMKSMHAHKLRDGEWESITLDISYEIKVGSLLSEYIKVRSCGCGRLLQCQSFSGEEVYLPVSEPGKFSLIGEGYLTGPQTISSMCSKRFPINVKLMEGSPRPIDFEGFVPTLKLHQVDFEEQLTVWPMQKGVPLVHIPTNCPMQLKTVNNLESLLQLPVYNEIVRRINSFLPKCKTRPRWYQHTQSSLTRSVLQKSFTTTASRGRYNTTRTRTTTSATGIRPTSTSCAMTSTSIDIHQPSTTGHLQSTSTAIPSWFSTGPPIASGLVTSTSGYFQPISTDIHQPSTALDLSNTATNVRHSTSRHTTRTTTDVDQPSTSGFPSSFQKWASKRFSKQSRSSISKISEDADNQPSEPNLPDTRRKDEVRSVEVKSTEDRTDYQESVYSSLHSDMLGTLIIDSKSSEDTEIYSLSDTRAPSSQEGKLPPKTIGGIDDQKTSGELALESSSERSSPRTETLIQREDQQTSDLTAAHSLERRGDHSTSRGHRSSRIKTQHQRGNQESSGYAIAALRKFRSEILGSVDPRQTIGQSDVPPRFHLEPSDDIDQPAFQPRFYLETLDDIYQQTSDQVSIEPSTDRPSQRIETIIQRDDQQTSDLSATHSLGLRGDQPTSREHRSSRIRTQGKDDRESSGYAVAALRKFRVELLGGSVDSKQTTGQSAVPPRIHLEPSDDTDQQTSGQSAVPPRFYLETLDGIVQQQMSGQAGDRRSSETSTHYFIVDQMSLESSEGAEPPSTNLDDNIELLDEIDEIYAENKRIYNERCNIPLEKETCL